MKLTNKLFNKVSLKFKNGLIVNQHEGTHYGIVGILNRE